MAENYEKLGNSAKYDGVLQSIQFHSEVSSAAGN
jgi:hypothetical protein